jgi:hypothetical protein
MLSKATRSVNRETDTGVANAVFMVRQADLRSFPRRRNPVGTSWRIQLIQYVVTQLGISLISYPS